MKITRFEDIDAWQSARSLTNMVYDATAVASFDRDVDLRRQMRRAAVSSMGNIAEGFDAGSDVEFARFLRIAQRSATEVQSHLHVARDRRYLGQTEFDVIYAQARETRRLIGGFVRYLRASRLRSGDQGPGTKDQGQRRTKD